MYIVTREAMKPTKKKDSDMNIQKTFNIDENAKSWTIASDGKEYKTSSFCGACDYAYGCFLNKVPFKVINIY